MHSTKVCPSCKQAKETAHFGVSRFRKGGLECYCKPCVAKKAKDRRRAKGQHDLALTTYFWHMAENVVRASGKGRAPHNFSGRRELQLFLINRWAEIKGRCEYTGLPMSHIRGGGFQDYNVSIDRIDPTRGYTQDNIALCCWCVNRMKTDLTPARFHELCRLVLEKAQRVED